MKHPYIAAGLEQQGRQPEAAHAASELYDDPADADFDAECVIVWLVGVVLGVLVIVGGTSALVGWWGT